MRKSKQHNFKWWVVSGLALAMLSTAGSVISAERDYYRYINKDGVKVLNHYIPPEYVRGGYEVVSASGQVLRVVPPALTEEEAQTRAMEKQHQREMDVWDTELRRRFSRAADVDSAKKRKLSTLQGSLDILNSNLKNVRKQITKQHTEAAKFERRDVPIPENVLESIAMLEAKLAANEEQIHQRQQEFQQVSDKFDKDKVRFEIISR